MSTERTLVVYTHIPHYRVPVFHELINSPVASFELASSSGYIDPSIESGENAIPFVRLGKFKVGPVIFQFGVFRFLIHSEYKNFVFLGNPYIVSTWIYGLIAKVFRKRVYFWTHGWIKKEAGLRGFIRNLFYQISDGLLLYGDRAKTIGQELGHAPERLHVIYNSLDVEVQTSYYLDLRGSEARIHPEATEVPVSPYLISVGRLTSELQLDLALIALQISAREVRQCPFSLLIVGDGPERQKLEQIARDMPFDVRFLGQIYDERRLAKLIFGAIATIAPGKVGLTAMHSMVYGTPVITHNDPDHQMPEFEAITPGISGDTFAKGDPRSLSIVINKYLKQPQISYDHRERIRSIILQRYTPKRQVAEIITALTNNGST